MSAVLVHYHVPAERLSRPEWRSMVQLKTTPAIARSFYRNCRRNASREDARLLVLGVYGVPLTYRAIDR